MIWWKQSAAHLNKPEPVSQYEKSFVLNADREASRLHDDCINTNSVLMWQ